MAPVFSLGAWPWLSPISSMFPLLPYVCFLFASSIQYANGRWFFFFGFKTFSLEPFSHSACQLHKLVPLITSTFLFEIENLADLLLFCLNWTILWKIGLNWVITSGFLLQHPHYLLKVYSRITSRLLSAYFVKKSVAYYIPDIQGPAVSICSSFYSGI